MNNTDDDITILLVDDHAIVREGYRALLAKQPRLRVVAEAKDGGTAYQQYKQHAPAVVIMDITLPGQSGLETIARIKQRDSQAKILVFSMHQNPSIALQATRAGALGYVTKSSAPDVLVRAIYDVYAGRPSLSADIAQLLALQQLGGERVALDVLTGREFEILRLLAEGQSTDDIANLLNISRKTVSNCHYLIKQKLGVANDFELAHLAIRMKVIDA
ncbi:MAG: response regulator transcription factor [Methylovulum sp.]|nr:response regulator transcription factor [Methylovulum sp.]